MDDNWHPKPRRPMGLDGLFEYDDPGEIHINKSQKANRWKQQRDQDGSPHTRPGYSALTPPPAGPKLYLEGLSKSETPVEEPTAKAIDVFEVVDTFVKGCAPEKASDEDEADDLEKGDIFSHYRGAGDTIREPFEDFLNSFMGYPSLYKKASKLVEDWIALEKQELDARKGDKNYDMSKYYDKESALRLRKKELVLERCKQSAEKLAELTSAVKQY